MVLDGGLFGSIAAPCLVWSGVLLAIGVEAPTKFKAKSVTRTIGLDVGRHVFPAINKVEWGVATAAGAILARRAFSAGSLRDCRGWQPLALAAGILAAQTTVLMPQLLHRASLIIDKGVTPPKSPTHSIYAAAELAKLASLLTAAYMSAAA